MSASFGAQISETDYGKIRIEIDKKDFESFCNVCGLFTKEFINYLEQSEKDHQEGRIRVRDSLFELIDE